ncbi:Rha family transcriptional regulator [Desulfobacula toluolica]|uniref:Phage regulatory protein, Rha family n=1 Tax=Desulfobacula toluolica (strain DSM 7467 / Tol2) TaxID=651182 RepID=K0NEF8_DESTT|nr:Rha family transcriptional regulator [Desulfobacula toluolica]CCK79431.1 phage regulatory protein, Rha family [Desulfobacula toluolica Tol2]
MTDLVIAKNNKPITTSLIVAETFSKRHDHVLVDIRELITRGVPFFQETPYIHPQNGQTYNMYEMGRDGFALLTMGFTGEKALKFKLKYIAAFNAMEQELVKISQGRPKELNQKAASIKAELNSRKALLTMEKQAMDEAKRIYRGHGNFDDLAAFPQLQAMTRDALELYKRNPTESGDDIVFRLNALVDAYLANLSKQTPMPDLNFTHTLDEFCTVKEVSFVNKAKDLLDAFNWLQKHKGITNPYTTVNTLAAGLIRTFKKSIVPVPGWQFQSRIKKSRGYNFHRFTKTIDHDSPVKKNSLPGNLRNLPDQ